MTITEYLNERLETVNDLIKDPKLSAYAHFYFKGKREVLESILHLLPTFEHEITVNDLMRYCALHECLTSEFSNNPCPFFNKDKCSDTHCIIGDFAPCIWDLDEIKTNIKGENKNEG